MKRDYDIVYLTNTPSFYKINLCNEIGKYRKLLLVLYGYGDEAVNKNMTADSHYSFEHVFLWNGNSAKRNKLTTFLRLWRLMASISYKKVLFSGWFVPEYNLLALFSPKRKNCMLCESTIYESSVSGIKGFIKKVIINRCSMALPSGMAHKAIFDAVGYKGEIRLTGGVGIFNKPPRDIETVNNVIPKRFLYVGRLIECKNLRFLIEMFNKNGKPLTVVGKGPLENELKSKANNNIEFIGFVDNDKLPEVYKAHDIFILPSRREPWGLVVEEAIYWGLPVITSNRVGCSLEMVITPDTGRTFKLDDEKDFDNAIKEVENNYETFRANALNFDFDLRDRKQVEAYTGL